MSAAVLRFAPTPNGFLHLGHAYSALLNAKLAAKLGGRLLLRLEDVDRSRCREEYAAAILDDLRWLGVEFEAPPRRQSKHIAGYEAALSGLRERALVYPCYCSRGQIAASGGARDPDGAPAHRGGCVATSPEETKARLALGEPPVWRLSLARARAEAPGPLTWDEFGEGEQVTTVAAEQEAWGDIVLRGRETAAAYHLAVVVDDAAQGVTDVARGRDLFAATSLHRLLQTLLGYAPPRYHHHRLALDDKGAKLSKSARSPSLRDLAGAGYSREDVLGALDLGPLGSRGLRVAIS